MEQFGSFLMIAPAAKRGITVVKGNFLFTKLTV